jgi:peptidyl-prolyl cis-trans isomerase C
VRAVKVPAMDEIKSQIAESLTQSKLAAYQEEMVKKAKVQ